VFVTSAPSSPAPRDRPLASTEGSSIETSNKIGVRFWTGMSSRSLLGPETVRAGAHPCSRSVSSLARPARFPKIFCKEPPVKEPAALLSSLKDISKRLNELASDKGRHELDADAIVDLNMARSCVDKLINRLERLVS
jgi:hypothetical protein